MVEQNQMNSIISELCSGLAEIFPGDELEPILFGSYARGDAAEGSDIDVFLLVNTPREEIFRKNRQIGAITGNLLLNYDVLVSPIVENREFYYQNIDVLPFFRNIQQEGVRIYA